MFPNAKATPRLLTRLTVWVFVIAAPGIAWGESSVSTMPANARAAHFGGGWQCVRGFREEDKGCVPVAVPPNAYLSSFGNGWECNRGYAKTDKACVLIKVPENA